MNNRWKHCKPAESVEWPTPPALYKILNDEFRFTLDPCPLGGSEDGLSTLFKQWRGERVFANPPYGPGLHKWFGRALEADLAVFLVPARLDTRWFHRDVLPFCSEVRFIQGRLKFGEAQTAAPFASMVVVFEAAPLDGQMRLAPVMRSMKAP